MIDHRPRQELATHRVHNQPPPLPAHNVCEQDPALIDALAREGAAWLLPAAQALGEEAGSPNTRQLAAEANRHPPELRLFDRYGQRLDEVSFHPAYHALMAMAMRHRVHSIAWTAEQAGGHVAHAAMLYLMTQAEAGVCCPMAMTYAAIPTLWHSPALAEIWEGRFLSGEYDARCIPAADKHASTCGMALTEKQGGSDLHGSSTTASPLGTEGAASLRGHKWFCSAPMSDAFFTLARDDAGLSCYLAPRWRPDGSRNAIQLQRLKDKLGNRSNASAEIEYHDAWAMRVGAPGRGIATIIDMVHHTRLSATLSAAGIMRQALVEALHHCRHRRAFDRPLAEQPLMRAVLADLALEVEAALLLGLRVAHYFDAAAADDAERPLARLTVAIAKYQTCKRAPTMVAEAMECLGGGGYVEESALPRLYREAPVNGIWEGSGNVICLDLLRTIEREPAAMEQLLAELDRHRGQLDDYDRRLNQLPALLEAGEAAARALCERLALLMQTALLLEAGQLGSAALFCQSRLGETRCGAFSGLSGSDDVLDALLARALPAD